MFKQDKPTMDECQNCGARLPVPDDEGAQRCSFCRTVTRVPQAPKAPPTPQQIHINVGSNVPRAAKKGAAGCGLLTTLVVLMVVVGIGVPIYFAVRGAVDTAKGLGNLIGGDFGFGTGFAVLPGEPSSPSIVALSSTYEGGANTARLVRFDAGRTEPAWTTGKVADSADAAVITDATRAYVVKSELVAVNLADGKEAWRVKLSDEHRIGGDCRDCFTLAGDVVLTRTVDGTLHALDAATGAARWTRQFADTQVTLHRVGPHVVAQDRDKGDDKLATLDLATGQDAVVIPVTCASTGSSYTADLDSSTIVQPAPAGAGILTFFGGSTDCAQSWDVTTGAKQWEVRTGISSFDRSGTRILDSPHGLVFTSRGVAGLIDPTRTSFRKLVDDDEQQLSAIGVHGNLLVAEQRITRGTQKYGLVAIDLGTGEARWTHTTGKAQRVGGFGSPHFNTSSDGTFLTGLAGGRVLLVTFIEGAAYESTLKMEALDASTGQPTPARTMESGTKELIPSFGPGLWLGDKVVARVGDDTIQVLDPGNGTVVTKIG